MFTSLHAFYTSKEWREFRKAFLAEKDAGGFWWDEYSKQKILRDHEVILHHKQPLTLQNVNDYTISLNPANIMLVSIRSHNEIHKRFGAYWNRKVYFVWGAPCSGKSSFVNANKCAGDLVVDMDLIWQSITGGEKYDKPAALKQNAFMIRDALFEQVKTRAGQWGTAYIVSTEARAASRERICRALGAEQIYIDCTKAEALERLHADKERENFVQQWTGYIEKFFDDLQM